PVSGQPLVLASATRRFSANCLPSWACWPLPPTSRSSLGGFDVGQALLAARAPAPEAASATATVSPVSTKARFMLPPLVDSRRQRARPRARSDADSGLRSRARG